MLTGLSSLQTRRVAQGLYQDRPGVFETIVGTGAGETLKGGDGDDSLVGLDGDDLIKGFAGDDTLRGGDGDDHLKGYGGRDVLDGGEGDDKLAGGSKRDFLDGGVGQDKLFGSDGGDRLRGGEGLDELFGGSGNDKLSGGSEPDFLYGGGGDDFIRAGDGNDSIRCDPGNDTVIGGQGVDFADYSHTRNALLIDLRSGLAIGLGTDRLRSVEGAIAGRGDDILVGNDKANLLTDLGGADTFNGGLGQDTLFGGRGADTFIYADTLESRPGKPDRTDAHGTDIIDLSAIDADATTSGNQAFVLVENFSHNAGELRVFYDSTADNTYAEVDTDGDGRADMRIQIDGQHANFDGFVL